MAETIVELQSGLVRGSIEKHDEGFEYYSFKKIPYAEPPLGELRFKDPVPKAKWSGVLDCNDDLPKCLQYDYVLKLHSYEEDCLYLNVFTHSINEINKRSPVIMIVHNGVNLFGTGASSVYGPDHFIRKDVVLVIANYRLGVLGFLDLEDEIAPGNQGLKDLVLVLEWIQQNIEKFGGDPSNVTVFGACSSGCTAHYLALSPLTKGLIHKVISGGTVAYNVWARIFNPKSNAIKLCSLLGKDLTDPKEIFEFLQSVDAKSLQEAQERLRGCVDNFPFGPGIDKKSAKPFLSINQCEAADHGVQLPYLVGCNIHETTAILAGVLQAELLKMANTDFNFLLRHNVKDILNRHNLHANQIKRLYYKSEMISPENSNILLDYGHDLFFYEGLHRFSKVQVEKSSAPTYLYQFSYIPPLTTTEFLFKDMDIKYKRRICHFETLPFLFKIRSIEQRGYPILKKGTQNYKIMEQLTEMWTNFARYGRPTVDISELIPVHWKPINDGTLLRYLNIDVDITMQTTVNIEKKILSAKDIQV